MGWNDRLQDLAARSSRKPYVWLLLLLAALSTYLGAELSDQIWPGKHGDVRLYFLSAARFVYGSAPYRDFRFEYPPLALIPLAVPYLLGRQHFEVALLLSNALWVIGIGICVVIAARRSNVDVAPGSTTSGATTRASDARAGAALWSLLLLVAACSPLVPWRFDLFPAFLTILAFVCLVRGRAAGAGVFLGLGAAAKLYPVILGPVFALYYATQRRWRELGRLVLAAVVATLLPFLWIALVADSRAALSFLRYHGARGIQIESLFSGIVLLTRFGSSDVNVTTGSGSWNLSFPGEHTAIALQSALLLVGLGVAYALCLVRLREEAARATPPVETIATCAAGVILTFIITNRVFSPQYLAWLLPFAPFLRLPQLLATAALFVLTMAIYPASYDALLEREFDAVLLLNARNVLAVVLVFWIFWGSRRAAHGVAAEPLRAAERVG